MWTDLALWNAAKPQPASRAWLGRTLRGSALVLIGLLVTLVLHSGYGLLSNAASIGDPGEIDYAEGIVWQQAALVPGPSMYGTRPELPFIVFNYPPLYYLAARLAAAFMPDLLSAGRLVSAVSAIAIAVTVAGLVLAATPDSGRLRGVCAAVAGLLAYNVHALRVWSLLMRVDTLAVALALAGVLVAARSNAGWRSTAAALLLCVAAVYCKQTELPAGLAVLAIASLRNPHAAAAAASVALVAGLAPLAGLQWVTHGGFLHNIIGGNINRVGLAYGLRTLAAEARSLPLALLTVYCGVRLIPRAVRWRAWVASLSDRVTAARAVLLLYLALSTLMLPTICKSGGDINYFLEWLCLGAALTGVLLHDIMAHARGAPIFFATLCAAALVTPVRFKADQPSPADQAVQDALLQRVKAADKPVASEDMVLLLRAGKTVMYEPAIVTELAAVGRWDERPLVAMIASGGFAFMLTEDDAPGDTPRRSPAVNEAMRAAYPVVELVSPSLWMHRPPP